MRWSLKRKLKTKKYRLRNKTVIYKVAAYGKWSLKRVVVKRELTVQRNRRNKIGQMYVTIPGETREHLPSHISVHRVGTVSEKNLKPLVQVISFLAVLNARVE